MLNFYLTLGRISDKATAPIMSANSFYELRGLLPDVDQFKQFLVAASLWGGRQKEAQEKKKEFTEPAPSFKIELDEESWIPFCREVRRKSSARIPSSEIKTVYLLGGDSRYVIGRVVKK